MPVKFFVLFSTIVMLSPSIAANAQSYSRTVSQRSSESHVEQSVQIETTSKTPQIVSHQDDKQKVGDRTRIIHELIDYPYPESPQIVIRCQQNFVHQHDAYSAEIHSSNNALVRELLNDHGHQAIAIDIQGQCQAVRIYLDGDRHTFDVYPGLLNHHNSDYDQHWDPDYPSQYYVPWLIREGSGWDWFLRDR